MKNSVLKIDKIDKSNNRLEIAYSYSGDWNKYLAKRVFCAEYSCNIESVPDGLAVIPLLVNVIPIAWFFGLEIEVDELDRVFYDALPNIMCGYQDMYPNIEFRNNIRVSKKANADIRKGDNSAVLFSGGVDANCTLLRHIREKVDIVTIFGADIKLGDMDGISVVNALNKEIADDLNINYRTIYSNFREIINYHNLYRELVDREIIGEWWHEFQHGIGLIGLVAPLSFVNGYRVVYIASSYCEKQKGTYTCASDPMIDNELMYGSTTTVHDGYELTRQDKIKFICGMRKKLNLDRLRLRVCWESSGGKNCCRCEKCYRTIIGLMAEKEDPNNYYFDFGKNSRRRMMRFLRHSLVYDVRNLHRPLYVPIQERFRETYSYDEMPKDIRKFLKIRIGARDPKVYLMIVKIKKKLKSIFNR